MLNPFPDLLVLGFFAPTLLRVAAGLVFLYFANMHLVRERAALEEGLTPRLGPQTKTIINGIGALEILVGALLLVGFYTQLAALAGIALMGLFLWKRQKYGALTSIGNSPLYLLLAAVCASLLLSGAGAIAFDLPL